MRSHPETFERKGDAERVLTLIEAQMIGGDWTDPIGAKVKLKDYAQDWIAQRPGLRPRTADLYRWLLAKHITPYLGSLPVRKITAQAVRHWRAELLVHGVSATWLPRHTDSCALCLPPLWTTTSCSRATRVASEGPVPSGRLSAPY